MTTSGEMREKYLADTYAQAKKAFARHELSEASTGRWVLRRRHSDGSFDSTYWTEVCCMSGGYLYVNGDIDLVVFGYGPADAVSRVAWMAKASETYAAEKASIGMTSPRNGAMVYDWRHDIAVQRIREALTSDDGEEPEITPPDCFGGDAEEAIENLERMDSSEEAFTQWLYEHFAYDEFEGLCDAGRVLSSRVIYAQAALARLLELLDARDGACGARGVVR